MFQLGSRFMISPERRLDPVSMAALLEIPGAQVWNNGKISIPSHGAWVVDKLLEQRGVPYSFRWLPLPNRYVAPASEEEALAGLRQSELLPGVWDGPAAGPGGFQMKPFQRTGVLEMIQAGSGILLWKAGAGKTPAAIAWAVGRPFDPTAERRTILTVTKAAVRRQWAREVKRLSGIDPWISDPIIRQRADWVSPQDYQTQCFLTGTRPWLIVGWEELAELVYGEKAHILEESVEDRRVGEKLKKGLGSDIEALARVHGVGMVKATAIISHFGSLARLQQEGLHYGPDHLAKRLKAIKGVGPVLIRTVLSCYQLVRPEAPREKLDAFLRHLKLDAVIFDELHLGKSRERKKWVSRKVDPNQKSRRRGPQIQGYDYRNMTAAAAAVSSNAERRLGTTATFVPDRMRDTWGQLTLIDPKGWSGYSRFATRYCAAHQGAFGRIDTGLSNWEEFSCRLGLTDAQGNYYMDQSGAITGVRGEWAFASQVPEKVSHGELPPKRREVRRISPNMLSNGDASAAAAMDRERDDTRRMHAALEWTSTRKRPIIVEEVVDRVLAGQKVLVFSGRRDDVERTHAAIARKLKVAWTRQLMEQGDRGAAQEVQEEKRGVPGVWRIHGEDNFDDRDTIARDYMAWRPEQHGDLGCVLVATGASMGTGIDLQDTDTLLMSMLPVTPKDLEQWEGRTTRPGQTRPVLIIYFIAEGTVDEHLATLLIDKLPTVATIMGQTELATVADELEGIGNDAEVLRSILAAFIGGSLGGADMEDDGD